MPVGRCVTRIAESVLLTCWPPAPEARKVSTRSSAGLSTTSLIASASGSTATEQARDHFLVAAELGVALRDDLDLPPLALGIARVHAEQVAGEQRRLVAAGPRAHCEEQVAVVVRVARQQRFLQPGLE